MVNIQNIDIYNMRMQKGMKDKLFFIDQLPQNKPFLFVDFGCADGTLLKLILELFPNSIGMGIDSNEDMIILAKKNCSHFEDNRVLFYNSLNDCLQSVHFLLKEDFLKVLNFSSVIHEIYHYCPPEEKDNILDTAFSGIFDRIFIRDICCLHIDYKVTPQSDLDKLYSHIDKEMIGEFEECFGSLHQYKNFVHFLMKYKYKENWDRECQENYFFNFDNLLSKLNKSPHQYILKDYQLPYLTQLWKEELDVSIKSSTHFHLVITKNNEEM